MRARTTTTLALSVALACGLTGCSGVHPPTAAPPSTAQRSSAQPSTAASSAATFAALEQRFRARLGLVVLDPRDGRTVQYRADERFPFASTNKVFIAAAVLDRSSTADLDAVVHFDRSDLLAYAPVTERHLDTGMTVRELVDAALRYSDNTAANLLVERLGGPAAVQRWVRSTGDRVTRVDRVEPDLNTAVPGDPRDTTTPLQFAADLRAVLLGDVLSPAARALLRSTMAANTTGDATIRAGVPSGWEVADKTGTGERGVRNDIGIVTPPGGDPLVVVVTTRTDDPDAASADALVAAATRAGIAALRTA